MVSISNETKVSWKRVGRFFGYCLWRGHKATEDSYGLCYRCNSNFPSLSKEMKRYIRANRTSLFAQNYGQSFALALSMSVLMGNGRTGIAQFWAIGCCTFFALYMFGSIRATRASDAEMKRSLHEKFAKWKETMSTEEYEEARAYAKKIGLKDVPE